ncbi:hypothetical protein TNCV_1332731 [Trichonephila clavipes]|nr:hypothetical protein TNCV_1332731 [Trichonephila clavipes]
MTRYRQSRERNFRSCRPLRCLYLPKVNINSECIFAGVDQYGTVLFGGLLIFSDASRFQLCLDHNRRCIWKRPDHHGDPALTLACFIGT